MCSAATQTELLPEGVTCGSRETREIEVDGELNSGFLDIKIKDKRQVAVIRLKSNDLIVVSAKVHSIRWVFL
jgi:menaquinone-dependent protoporphyrinogen IX oxidase